MRGGRRANGEECENLVASPIETATRDACRRMKEMAERMRLPVQCAEGLGQERRERRDATAVRDPSRRPRSRRAGKVEGAADKRDGRNGARAEWDGPEREEMTSVQGKRRLSAEKGRGAVKRLDRAGDPEVEEDSDSDGELEEIEVEMKQRYA